MALIERASSSGGSGPINFFPGIYLIVAAVAFPVCLAGILAADQLLIRFDPDANLYKVHWALVIGGLAGTLICLPFVIFGGAEPTLGPVFGLMSGLGYLIASERRPAVQPAAGER